MTQPFPVSNLTEAEQDEFVQKCLLGQLVIACIPIPKGLEPYRVNFIWEEDFSLIRQIFRPVGGGAFSQFAVQDLASIGVLWEDKANRDPKAAATRIEGVDFHKHLDECEHCRTRPFFLCEKGQKLLETSGNPRKYPVFDTVRIMLADDWATVQKKLVAAADARKGGLDTASPDRRRT